MISNRLKLITNYLFKNTIVSSMPVEVVIGITNACNSRCIMCPRPLLNDKNGFMEFDVFKKIIDEVSDYVELVYLHFDGEPLLHPELLRFIEYAKSKGVVVGFSTNGILLNEETSKKLIDASLDYLIISVDATTSETYKKIKGIDKYSVVENNVIQLLLLERKNLYVVVQMVRLDENKEEREWFREKWSKYNIDSIRIKPAINFASSVDVGGKTVNNNPCFLLWRQMGFRWDGEATGCCVDFYGESLLGNIKKYSFQELWNSEKMVDLRMRHRENNRKSIKMCANCNIMKPNNLFVYGGSLFDDFTVKKGLMLYESGLRSGHQMELK